MSTLGEGRPEGREPADRPRADYNGDHAAELWASRGNAPELPLDRGERLRLGRLVDVPLGRRSLVSELLQCTPEGVEFEAGSGPTASA